MRPRVLLVVALFTAIFSIVAIGAIAALRDGDTSGTRPGVVSVDVSLGRSTHLGCRLMWVGNPKYQRFTSSPEVEFEDPCGGSVFALDGSCVGGPAPRALDHYPVRVVGGTAKVRVDQLIKGQTRIRPSEPS